MKRIISILLIMVVLVGTISAVAVSTNAATNYGGRKPWVSNIKLEEDCISFNFEYLKGIPYYRFYYKVVDEYYGKQTDWVRYSTINEAYCRSGHQEICIDDAVLRNLSTTNRCEIDKDIWKYYKNSNIRVYVCVRGVDSKGNFLTNHTTNSYIRISLSNLAPDVYFANGKICARLSSSIAKSDLYGFLFYKNDGSGWERLGTAKCIGGLDDSPYFACMNLSKIKGSHDIFGFGNKVAFAARAVNKNGNTISPFIKCNVV